MKITELLEQMHINVLYRSIGRDELSEAACVLMGCQPRENHILVLPAGELAGCFAANPGKLLCLFCAGIPDAGLQVPDGCSVVGFEARLEDICMDAQQAMYQLRRKADSMLGRESLLDRLMEGRLQGNENSAELLQALGLNPARRFCMVLVSFFGRMEEIPWEDAARQLSRALGNCPVAEYRGDLLALCSLDRDEITFRCPTEQLERFLAKQSAYAVVSNSAMRPTAIRALYQQSRSAMRFGMALEKDAKTRVFYYEKYAFYHMVELCAGAYHDDLQIHNMVYLCHPSLGSVLRYDRSHHTNYADILRNYLENNCNMSQTAREMFMHRNTMLNKLETLKELLGVSLDDPVVREQLQFSFHVVDYAEKILQGRTF